MLRSLGSGAGGAIGRVAMVALLTLSVAGCPAPIPHCTDWRTYLPAIAIGNPDDGAADQGATVIGSLALDPPVSKSVISLRLAKLDGDVMVATADATLPKDGRIYWRLAPGSYAIFGMRVMSDYAEGSYQMHRLLSPNLHFEAKGVRYIGHARILTDPGSGPLPPHLFPVGAVRQWVLGVRDVAIVADPGAAPALTPRPAALSRPDVGRAPMRWHPVEAYAARHKEACSKWSYVAWCFGWYCV